MKTGYKVCDIMTQKPVSVEFNTSIVDCAKVMAENHVGSLIVRKSNRLVGIIREKDIVRKILALSLNPSKMLAQDIMEKKFVRISPEKDLYDAIILMRDKNVRHIPVMSKKTMVGLLTGKDILKVQPQLFELLVDKIELKEQVRKLQHFG